MSEMQPILDEEQATEFNNLLRKALDKYPMFMEIFHQLGRKSITTLEIYDYLLSVDRPVSALEMNDKKTQIPWSGGLCWTQNQKD